MTTATEVRQEDEFDNPIERLELLAGDDAAISSFLDRIDVTGPRDREMLAELARTRTSPTRSASRARTAVPSRGWRHSPATASTGPGRPAPSAR